MNGISIILCCYNSAGRIEETLRYLLRQTIPNYIAWEIILINNACSDNTVALATRILNEHGGHTSFRIVDQPIAGLTAARQKGIEVSTYDLLIFCDDDNHLEPDYIQQAFELMSKSPMIGIAGGWIKPKLPFYPGKWIDANYSALAIGKRAEHSGYVDWVFGAGMVFRKQILEDLKSRNIGLLLSDRKGHSQSSGGDAEMCQLTRFIGYKIYFSTNLVLHHQIEEKRLTKKSFIQANLQNLQATAYLHMLDDLIHNKNKSFGRTIAELLRKRTLRIVTAFPRLVIGRNSFLNFLEVYVGSIFVSWIISHKAEIKKSFVEIKQNLYNGGRGY